MLEKFKLGNLKQFFAALKVGPANPDREYSFGLIRPNLAGVGPISHDRAFMVAAVWACIDVIAAALSSSDWNVYSGRRHADNKQALPDDNLQYILNTRFNREMTAQSGKRAMVIAAVGYGNGYAEIERNMMGDPVALWPISPDRVEPRRDLETGRLFYRVTQDNMGGFVDLAPEDLFIVRGAGLTGIAGDDAIGRAINSVALSIALEQFGSTYFGNNTQLGLILEYPNLKKLDDETQERITKSFTEKHSGPKNAFRPFWIDGGMKVHQLTANAQQAQMLEMREYQINEICRWFRVPPHKIASLTNSTRNNIEHQGLEFSRDTLRPWVQEIQQECDFKLFRPRVKRFVEVDIDWAEQGDYKSRMEAYQIARGMGVFSANDILRKLGENTIGTAGDARIVNGASVRLEDVGKNMLPSPNSSNNDVPEDDSQEPEEDNGAQGD